MNKAPRKIKYAVGNKFILKGDEVDTGTYPDYVTIPTRDWIIAVDHDPADNREADGKWVGTLVQEKTGER